MKDKNKIILNNKRDVTLHTFIATNEKKLSFLICPGGGYTNCEESEGIPVAEQFNEMGYNAFILRYSVGKYRDWPNPLEDVEKAMEFLKIHADEYAIDVEHIVIVGFSAGGHVAGAAATIARNRPYAAILCYGLAARETLNYCSPNAPDLSELVSEDTIPCFLASSRTDWIVPITDTTKLMEAFQRNFVDYEAHIYGYSLHGFSIGEKAGATGALFCSRVGNWVQDSIEWLEELVSGRYKSIKECAKYNDLYSKRFSTMNSCKVLFENKEAAKIIKYKFPVEYMIYIATSKKVGNFIDTVSLRQTLELLHVKEETLAKMDQMLQKLERGCKNE